MPRCRGTSRTSTGKPCCLPEPVRICLSSQMCGKFIKRLCWETSGVFLLVWLSQRRKEQ